jgi:hypothetical protein
MHYYGGYTLSLDQIQGYVCLCKHHSFVAFSCLNCACESIRVCLAIGISFQCAVSLMSDRLYYMCVLCQVCVGHDLSFVYLILWPEYVPYIGL